MIKRRSLIPDSQKRLLPCLLFSQMLWLSLGQRWTEHVAETREGNNHVRDADIRELLFLIWVNYCRSAIHYRPPLFYPYLLLHQTQVEQCATQHTYIHYHSIYKHRAQTGRQSHSMNTQSAISSFPSSAPTGMYTPHPHHSLYTFLHQGETGPHATFLPQQPQVGLWIVRHWLQPVHGMIEVAFIAQEHC